MQRITKEDIKELKWELKEVLKLVPNNFKICLEDIEDMRDNETK